MTDCSLVAAVPPYTTADCHIAKDEDWLDQLPQFLDGDVPTNLTDVSVEIFIRPVFDHSALIKKLTTSDGTIVKDDPLNGLLSINLPVAVVIAQLPIGTWDYFCRQAETLTINGVERAVFRERFRGQLFVHPGRT